MAGPELLPRAWPSAWLTLRVVSIISLEPGGGCCSCWKWPPDWQYKVHLVPCPSTSALSCAFPTCFFCCSQLIPTAPPQLSPEDLKHLQEQAQKVPTYLPTYLPSCLALRTDSRLRT